MLYVLLWLAVLATGAGLRFYDLGSRALHHDESLHAYYAWYISQWGTYEYNPMMHGPTQLFLMGWWSRVVGDSEAGVRSLAALCGTLLPFAGLVLLLRPTPARADPGGLEADDAPAATGRLTWPASTPAIDLRLGALIGGALLMASPLTIYYSRFFREDLPFAFLSATGALALGAWWCGGRRRNSLLALGLFALAMLIGIKLNALILWFTFFVFLNMWALTEAVRLFGARVSRQWLQTWLPSGMCLLRTLQAANLAGVAFLVLYFMAQRALPGVLFTPSPLLFLVLGSAALWLFAVAWLVRVVPLHPWRRSSDLTALGNGLWRCWPGWATGLALALAACMILFTDLLRRAEDPLLIFRHTFDYWLEQHKEQRIRGPFHYYVPILAMYHLEVMLVCLAGWAAALMRMGRRVGLPVAGLGAVLVGLACVPALHGSMIPLEFLDRRLHMVTPWHLPLAALWGWGVVTAWVLLARGDRLRAFLMVWTFLSLGIYGYAGEKTPWLSIHMAVPMILWAALELGTLAAHGGRARAVAIALATFMVVWGMFNGVRAAFLNGTNPAERMIYNTTAQVFHEAAMFAADAHRAAAPYDVPVLVAYEGAPAWPLAWYLRSTPHAAEYNTDRPPDIIFTDQRTRTGRQRDAQQPAPPYVWLHLPFRQFYTPPMLPVPRMLGWNAWEPSPERHPDMRYLHLMRTPPGADGPPVRPVTGLEAWGMLLRAYVLRQPFFDPEQPHGVWGAGITAHRIHFGVSHDLLRRVPELEASYQRLVERVRQYDDPARWLTPR